MKWLQKFWMKWLQNYCFYLLGFSSSYILKFICFFVLELKQSCQRYSKKVTVTFALLPDEKVTRYSKKSLLWQNVPRYCMKVTRYFVT